jgi:hypothetical protein
MNAQIRLTIAGQAEGRHIDGRRDGIFYKGTWNPIPTQWRDFANVD